MRGIVIAGTRSGVGKTSVTLALVTALRRRGYQVQTFKVGPDFLDPSYLTLASGRPCYNLDGWMMGRKYVEKLFARVTADADIVVIEGVMGLFDGSNAANLKGSTAEIAALLKIPVVLVVDVHGMARSFAATVKGYTTFDRRVKLGGVIANRCGSEKHALLLKKALQVSLLPPLVATIPRGSLPTLPSRHLGLVTADARNLSSQKLNLLADAFERHTVLEDFLKLADAAPRLHNNVPKMEPSPKKVRLGMAYDAAFHFYYQDFLDELELRGCELIRFSPISDTRLPEGINALYLGGGYPEERAADLAKNSAMLNAVRAFVESGRPVYAECGGLMYLCRTLEKADGSVHPMAGLVPAATRMDQHNKALAYREVVLKEDSFWGKKGSKAKGHEFHYSRLLENPAGLDDWRSVYSVTERRVNIPGDEGFQKNRVLASYVHLHLASRPSLVEHFIKTCEGSNI